MSGSISVAQGSGFWFDATSVLLRNMPMLFGGVVQPCFQIACLLKSALQEVLTQLPNASQYLH
jgi:hypothetical protein